jgi:hypothetical protein
MTELQGVQIDHPTVGNGIASWDAMASDLHGLWTQATAAVRALNDQAPWGDGSEGASFRAAYMAGGGPERLCYEGTLLVDEIVKVGPTVRKAVQNTITTDHAIAQDLKSNFPA